MVDHRRVSGEGPPGRVRKSDAGVYGRHSLIGAKPTAVLSGALAVLGPFATGRPISFRGRATVTSPGLGA
jgi:hypothetical protein